MNRKIIEKMHEGGPALVAALIARNISYWLSTREDRRYDQRYGVDTVAPVYRPALGLAHAHGRFGTSYHPTTVSALRKIFAHLGIDHRDYRFIEFGAGKGRVLLWAARVGFLRVTGIEHSRVLCEIAERNIASAASRSELRSPVDVVCGDATEFPIPEEPCVFYFYNPFSEEVARIVFERIAAARATAPRSDSVIWYPGPGTGGAALPQSYGFRLRRQFFVRDYLGSKREVFILASA